jgi:uncharacterized protein involved in exopolysaccharide biosynthesis
MARVDEAKQGQMIQVVDPASVPERRSWPPRTVLTLLAFMLAGIIASSWVILQAAFRNRMENPEEARKILQLRELLQIRRHRT